MCWAMRSCGSPSCPRPPRQTAELPPIMDLDEGYAVFENGWRIAYPPVIDRECGDIDIPSFGDFLRRFGPGSVTIIGLNEQEVTAVRCGDEVTPDTVTPSDDRARHRAAALTVWVTSRSEGERKVTQSPRSRTEQGQPRIVWAAARPELWAPSIRGPANASPASTIDPSASVRHGSGEIVRGVAKRHFFTWCSTTTASPSHGRAASINAAAEHVDIVVPVGLAPRRIGMERDGRHGADALRHVVADEAEHAVGRLRSTAG